MWNKNFIIGLSVAKVFFIACFIIGSSETSAVANSLSNSTSTITSNSRGVESLSRRIHKGLSKLYERLFGRKPGGSGTRGQICSLWPSDAADMSQIWRTEPVFIWKLQQSLNAYDYIDKILIQEVGSDTEEVSYENLDTHRFTRKYQELGSVNVIQFFKPNDLHLSPGKEYSYTISMKRQFPQEEKEDMDIPSQTYTFQVLGDMSLSVNGVNRDEIRMGIEHINQNNADLSPEKLAIERIYFFGTENGLWGDALQELFSTSFFIETKSVVSDIYNMQVCVIREQD